LFTEINDFIEKKFSKNFIKAINIVGCGKGTKYEITNTIAEVDKLIRLFNKGYADILIATSAVEEGLDIKDCDTVVVYTDLKTVKSYIQMKGRARKQNAKFQIFTDSFENTKDKINEYNEITLGIRGKFKKK